MLASELFHNHGKSFKNKDAVCAEFDGASYLVAALCQGHPHLIHANGSLNATSNVPESRLPAVGMISIRR